MTEDMGDKPSFLTIVKSPRYFASMFRGSKLGCRAAASAYAVTGGTGHASDRKPHGSVAPCLGLPRPLTLHPPSLSVPPLPLELLIFPKRT